MLIKIIAIVFISSTLFSQPENPLTKNPEYKATKISLVNIDNNYAGYFKSPDSIQFSLKAKDDTGNLIPTLKKEDFIIYILPPNAKPAEKYKCSGVKLKYFIDRYMFDIRSLPSQSRNGYYDLIIQLKNSDTIRKREAIFYSAPKINLVLICDTSSSMFYNDQQGYRKKALLYILDYARKNGIISKLAIIGFGTTARVLCNLTSIHNTQLDSAIDALDENGETNIGSALDFAFEQLKNSDSDAKKFAILLTDGQNTMPYHNNHKPFVDSKIPIYTIGLSRGADSEFLSKLAQLTGGEYYKAFESFRLQAIYNKVINKIADKKIVLDVEDELNPGETKMFPFQIDSFNSSLIITSSWNKIGCEIQFYDSKGNIIKSNNMVDKLYKFISINKPDSGEWKVKINNRTKSKIKYNVNAYLDSNLKIYLFPTIKKQYYRNEPINISLSIQQGNYIPRDVKTFCEIHKPDNKRETIVLSDNNKDGIFCNYFLNTSISGEYEFKIKVSGKNLKGEKFERFFIQNCYVSSNTQNLLSIIPSYLDFGDIEKEKLYTKGFDLVSTSDNPETISLYCQNDFISITPSLFIVEPQRSKHFDIAIKLPEVFPEKENFCYLIMESTKNSLAIPIKFTAISRKLSYNNFIRR